MKTIISEEYTYNTETVTAINARVIPLYEFHELNDDAQTRVIEEYAETRSNDPYFGQWFFDSYESEIWECVRDLEKSITGARVSWSYNRWYSADFDCEFSYNDCYEPGYMEPVENNGICYSFDLCDAWNAHVHKLNAIENLIHHVVYVQYEKYPCNEWEYCGRPENEALYYRLEAMYDDLIGKWYEEIERACDDVRNTIEYLLRSEWDYYTSDEYARDDFEANEAGYECRTIDNSGRVYYYDTRKWYTANGELFEESNVTRECVSIVKAG